MSSQSEYPVLIPGGRPVPGAVQMMVDSNGLAQAVTVANPMPVTLEAGSVSIGAVTVADGGNVVEGALADAAVVTDANGTISGKLRGLIKLWLAGLTAGEAHVGEVGGRSALITGTVTLPTGTPTYASGQLMANSATAGSVTPSSLTVGRLSSGSGATGMIRRLRLRKTGTSLTNASFRVHLFNVNTMTFANGDNAAFSCDKAANYVGKFDVTCDQAFTDGASGNAVPAVGSEVNTFVQTYYFVLEARAAYTRVASEVFTLEFETLQN